VYLCRRPQEVSGGCTNLGVRTNQTDSEHFLGGFMHHPRLTSFTVYRLFLLIALVVATLMGNSALAQVTTSSILGNITDPTGAAIPNADVFVKDVDRNLTKTVKSNGQGTYRVDFLLPGNYSVTVSVAGFKSAVHNGISLSAGVPATINVELSPGSVTESIQVTSSAPIVETSNAEIGTTIDPKDFTELPLVDRNAYTLLDLTPGVQYNTVKQSFGAPTQNTIINGGATNGSGTTNYYFDGAPNLNALNNNGGILPNPDTLQEFRVQTSNYGAAFGRFPNGIINALVRSGTNSIHGTVFEFLRNPHLNNRPWGSVASAPREPLHRNQFGATLGGPIIKNKAFYFGSYSGLRQTDATLQTGAIVPSALERTGDFTQSISTLPKDPYTGTNFVCNGVANVICSDRLDQTALKILDAYVPSANTTVTTSSGSAPAWSDYSTAPQNQDDFLIKGHLVASQAHTISATYFMAAGNSSAIASSSGSSLIPASYQNSTYRQQSSVLNDLWVITPNIVNNVWASYTRMRNTRIDTPQLSLADYGSTFTPQGTPSLPDITVTGYWHMPNQNAGPGTTDDYALRDLVTATYGKHTIQFGGEFLIDKASKAANLNNYGSITFSGTMTKNALADYLLGIPSSFEQDSPAYTRTSAFTYAGFIQDDYRITRRLMLNLGLRYDVQTPPVESADHNTTYIAGQQSTRFPNAPVGTVFPGDKSVPRGISPVRFAHFSPRVGFAFDPWGNAKMSIRGGVGLYWGSVSEEVWNQGGNTSPFALAYTFPNTSSLTGTTLSDPYRGGTNPFPNTGNTFPYGLRMSGVTKDAEWPETIQTNLSIQQQLTQYLGVTIAFVGGYSTNQLFGIDQNNPTYNTNYAASLGKAQCGTSATIVPTTSNSQCRRPIQPLGSFGLARTSFNTSYNGLQVTVTQRMAHHLSASGYYSWSKSISDVPLENSIPTGNVQDVNNLKAERGRTANDLTHQAVISLIWQPVFRVQSLMTRSVVNGWEIASLARLHTGAPFSVLNGVDANLDGSSGGDRAQLIGNPFSGSRSVSRWFNTSAFSQNSAVAGDPVDGNSGPYIINAPAYHGVDLTLARTFPIREKINFQFRAEASNAFNIVSYKTPGNTVKGGTFGVVTGANDMRKIQIGGKVTF
jgi:hypothetical protein